MKCKKCNNAITKIISSRNDTKKYIEICIMCGNESKRSKERYTYTGQWRPEFKVPTGTYIPSYLKKEKKSVKK